MPVTLTQQETVLAELAKLAGDAPFLASRRERNDGSRVEFKKAYEKLIAEGMTGLSYVEGEQLLGNDSEATADGSHPSDLGFWRQAEVLEPVIRKAIGL